ncbi:MAG TPA: SlyX family protein [Fibrobacteria bacterium]|nr:SlyX family protein [Fibrobacteria bacterium]
MSSDTDRLTELEIRLAHQERTSDQLHEVVLDLRKELESMRRKFGEIEAKLESDATEIGPANELPPHW